MSSWRERRDEAAVKHQAEIHDCNPNGYTVAPYVNSSANAHSFSDGFDAGRTDALREVAEKLEIVRVGLDEAVAHLFTLDNSVGVSGAVMDEAEQAKKVLDDLLKDLAEQEKEGSSERTAR